MKRISEEETGADFEVPSKKCREESTAWQEEDYFESDESSSGLCPRSLALMSFRNAENGSDGKGFVCIRDKLWDAYERKSVYNGEVGNWELDDTQFLERFSLPGQANKFDMLQHKFPFPRDPRVEFFEEDHIYMIDGNVKAPRSVTFLVHQFEEPFDADAIILKMRNGRNWQNKKKEYTNQDGTIMTDQQIKDKWEKNRDVSSSRGTLLHWHVEMFLNGAKIWGPYSTEFAYFLDFYRSFMLPRGLEPIRTEFSVFHTGLACAGQIDFLARYIGTETYVIIDWKRSKEIKHSNRYQNLQPPMQHLEQTNLNTYSLQLNFYRYILETEYGMRVDELYLVILHENNECPHIIPVAIMSREVDMIVQYEKDERHAREPTDGADALFTVEHLINIDRSEPDACVGNE